ncbi:TNF receptor-associated factor 5-like isoform X1 [Halichondria panicea]|uniref:TNF receptor-associated factor 5-like isoform X1 n=1 Tax=Halichondria panicea TaxID=6063 RepID=UPI00312BB4F9
MNTLVCVSCQEYLFHDPYQCDCGDRLCSKCYNSYVESGQKKFICSSCNEENIVANCFRDKAVEYELRNTTLKCLNQSCPWEGESRFYQEHKNSCKFGAVQCTNSIYGCKEELIRSQLQDHLNNKCNFNPITCRWCGQRTLNEDIHIQKECEMALDYCPNGCGERLPRREMIKHTKTVCTHQVKECDYKDLGCTYKGTIKELTKHAKEYPAYHTQLTSDNKTDALKSEISKIRSKVLSRLQLAVVKAESAIIQLQDGLSEVSLLLQTLQAASYDGTFIWNIPEVTRRRQEARKEKTASLDGHFLQTLQVTLPSKLKRAMEDELLKLKVDLRHLVEDLRPLAAQWRSLGVHLGVPPEELDCIESRVATPENCFARVLDRFLSTHAHTGTDDRRLCTEVIIEALRFPAIAKGNLSRDIESGKINLVYTVRGLFRILGCCTAQWQQFALALGISSDFIDSLRIEQHNVSQYFSDMLRYWLENGECCVADLVDAIRHLDHRNLADKIQEQYRGKCLVVNAQDTRTYL